MPRFELTHEVLDLRLRHPFTISRGTREEMRNIFIKLTADGITGYGEAAPNRRYSEDPSKVVRYLENLPGDFFDDVIRGEQLASRLDEIKPEVHAARAAVEMAWLDWHAKRQGKPLQELWKAPSRTGPVTSFTIGIDDLDTIRRKVKEAEEFPVLKVKLGTNGDRDIIQAIRAVTDKPLRVDANEGWETLQQARNEISFLTGQNVEMIEQPMPAAMRDELAALNKSSSIPICADESFIGTENLEDIAKAFDIINIKLMKIGSMVKAREIIRKAKQAGLKVMIGCMIESSLANTAGAILSLWADYADLDGHLLIENDPFAGLKLDAEKRIILTDRPGLGVRKR